LNIGKMFGGSSARNANNRAATGTRGKGRVQIYRPGDPELTSIFRKDSDTVEPIPVKNEEKQAENSSNDKNLYYRPVFQTPFHEPPIHQGGFTPIIPGVVSGFTPITDPTINVQINNETEYEIVPLVTEPPKNGHRSKYDITVKPSHNAPYFLDGISINGENSKEEHKQETIEKPVTSPPSGGGSSLSYYDDDSDGDESIYKVGSKYEENVQTTSKMVVEVSTSAPKKVEKPFQFNAQEQNIVKEIVKNTENGFYDGINHSPSSLSALVGKSDKN
jgi:hypothetical protein